MASYNKFNYNYRPSKSIERKIFIELLKEIYGVSRASELTYIGFGSIFFADFKLIHKELGVRNMINIEAEETDKKRFEFNKPFANIDLQWGTSTEILPTIDWNGKKIVWLDYDKALQEYMLEDIGTVFSTIEDKSFFFISCNSQMSKFYNPKTNVHDEAKFKAAFGNYAPYDLTPEMMTNANSPSLLRSMFNSVIKSTLNNRNAAIADPDLQYIYSQLLYIVYKDGAPMFSLGGLILKRKDFKKFTKSKFLSLPYISTGENYLDIESPLLTNSEVDLINTHLPEKKVRFLKNKDLAFLPPSEIEKYYNFYRYYPSFVEIREF